MHEKGSRESQTLVDDGTGTVEVWRIEDFDMVPLDKGLYGQFFGGDSYVVLYTYEVNRKENYIIYFWQGQVGGATYSIMHLYNSVIMVLQYRSTCFVALPCRFIIYIVFYIKDLLIALVFCTCMYGVALVFCTCMYGVTLVFCTCMYGVSPSTGVQSG